MQDEPTPPPPGGQAPRPGQTPPPPPASGSPPRQTSGMAIASMVLGIVSFMGLSLLGSIPAVVLGHMARQEIDASAGRMEGDGLAVAGLVLGYINIALHVLGCVIGILMIAGFGALGIFAAAIH